MFGLMWTRRLTVREIFWSTFLLNKVSFWQLYFHHLLLELQFVVECLSAIVLGARTNPGPWLRLCSHYMNIITLSSTRLRARVSMNGFDSYSWCSNARHSDDINVDITTFCGPFLELYRICGRVTNDVNNAVSCYRLNRQYSSVFPFYITVCQFLIKFVEWQWILYFYRPSNTN